MTQFFSMSRILPENRRKGPVPNTKNAYQEFLKVAWPAAMQGLLIDLMMTIDLAMVGTLGAWALASVGVMSQPKMVLHVMMRALSVPITALVARRMGEGNRHAMNATLKQGMSLTLLLYLPIVTAAFYFLPQIILFTGGQSSLIEPATLYGRYVTIGVFFTAFTQVIGAALVGTGNTKVVFKANVMGNAVNTILNIVLIHGIGPFPRMEVAGAGLATMIGNIVALLVIIREVIGSDKLLTLNAPGKWFDPQILKPIGKLGSSSLGEQAFERFGMYTYTMMVARLGVVPLAAHHVVMSLCDIFYSFTLGLGSATASHTGQNLGKKRSDMAEAYGKIGIRVGFALGLLAFAIYALGRTPLMWIYTQDAQVIALGKTLTVIMALATVPQAFQLVYSGVLKGAGDNFYVMVYSLGVIAVFRPLLTYLLCFPLGFGIYGAWIALVVDQSLRMVFSAKRFYGGKWKHVRI